MMAQPLNRFELIRLKRNKFKRLSVKVANYNYGTRSTGVTQSLFGLPGFINAPNPVGGLQVMQGDPIYAAMQESSFNITSSTNTASPGQTVTLMLDVNGVSDNSYISYTISGINLSDIDNSEQLNLYESGDVIYGDFNVNNGSSTLSIILGQSVTSQTMDFYLTNGKSNTINIQIN